MPATYQGVGSQLFQDPEQAILQRKLAEAKALREGGMSGDIGEGYRGGRVFIVGNALGNVAKSIGGAYLGDKAEKEHTGLMQARQQAEQGQFDKLAAISPTEQKTYSLPEDVAGPVGTETVNKTPQQLMQETNQAIGGFAPTSQFGQQLKQAVALKQAGLPYEQMDDERKLKQALALKDAEIAGREPKAPVIKQTSLAGDMVQDQQYDTAAKQWVKIGEPYHRFAKQLPTVVKVGGDTGGSELTPEGMKVMDDYAVSGKMPSFGYGPKAIAQRNDFFNREGAKRFGEGGTGASPAADQATAKANSTALTAITKDLAAIRPFAEMLDKNVVIAKDLAKNVIATDSRLVNRPVNWLRQNVADYPQAAEFLAQVRFVQTEAARVLNNPRLVGQLTDSARKEMEHVVSGDMPLGSFNAVMDRIISDSKNRIDAMSQEQSNLQKNIGGNKPSALPQATAPAGGAPALSDAAYAALKSGQQYVAPDGSLRRKK